jgi:MFS family permease
LADRRGPRGVLLVGLLGFGVTMLVFSFAESLTTVYAERFACGMFAAVVAPVAAAVGGSLITTGQTQSQ